MRRLVSDIFGGAGAACLPIWMILDWIGISCGWIVMVAGAACAALAIAIERA